MKARPFDLWEGLFILGVLAILVAILSIFGTQSYAEFETILLFSLAIVLMGGAVLGNRIESRKKTRTMNTT